MKSSRIRRVSLATPEIQHLKALLATTERQARIAEDAARATGTTQDKLEHAERTRTAATAAATVYDVATAAAIIDAIRGPITEEQAGYLRQRVSLCEEAA